MQQETQHTMLLVEAKHVPLATSLLWHHAENFSAIPCNPLCISSPYVSSYSIHSQCRSQSKRAWINPLLGSHKRSQRCYTLSHITSRAKSSQHPQEISCLVRSWCTSAKPQPVSKYLQTERSYVPLDDNDCIFHLPLWNRDPRWSNMQHENLTSNPSNHCKQQCNWPGLSFPFAS